MQCSGKALVSTVTTERSLKDSLKMFESHKNLDFLALQEIVSIKNNMATGLRLKMVFFMICTPMIAELRRPKAAKRSPIPILGN